MFWVILSAILITLLTAAFYLGSATSQPLVSPKVISSQRTPFPTPAPSPVFSLAKPPAVKIIPHKLQVFQTFNNCGPAALSMTLSYFGINESQQKLGNELRPYQNPQGDNDDKSVTLDEL